MCRGRWQINTQLKVLLCYKPDWYGIWVVRIAASLTFGKRPSSDSMQIYGHFNHYECGSYSTNIRLIP